MALYKDLYTLRSDATFRNRIAVAVAVEVDVLLASGTASDNEKWWMKRTLELGPERLVDPMMWAVLAANKGATTAVILAANDATLQAKVHDAVAVFATIGEGADKSIPIGAGT